MTAVTTSKCAGVYTGNDELSWKVQPQHFNCMAATVSAPKKMHRRGDVQKTAFEHIKELLKTAPIFTFYDLMLCQLT